MIGEQSTAPQDRVWCGGMGMGRMEHRPVFSFPFRTCHPSGAGSWVPRGGPRGRESGRRRSTHPPPQEAERCTWRRVLQLSPETGPAGRERRQWRRGQAQDQSGEEERTEGRAAAAPGHRRRSPHPPRIQPPCSPQPRERSVPPDRHAALWPAHRRPGDPSRHPAPRG